MLPSSPRAVCYRCFKPQVTCVCASITKVENRTSIFVLQHPRERLHPIGTVRIAALGLTNVRVDVAWNAGQRETRAPAWLPEGAAVLYPSPAARDLRTLPASERPSHLVVIDGTWNTAHTLYRDKQWLHALPHVRIVPDAPGRYRLRREPELDYLSTIEAIVSALCVLEPQTQGLSSLLAAFDAMIDAQLRYVEAKAGGARARKRRPAAERRIPRTFLAGEQSLVLSYAEAARTGEPRPSELVQLIALDVSDGRVFERIVRPSSGLPDAQHLGHMGIGLENFEDAVDADTVRRDFRAFLEHGARAPLVTAWNQSTLALLSRVCGCEVAPWSLKSIYRAVYGRADKSLEDVVARHVLDVERLALHGRGGTRIASALSVVRLLQARARAVA